MKKILLLLIVPSFIFNGCRYVAGKTDKTMSELECPVILIGKTDKGAETPSVVVVDGTGRVRTFFSENGYDSRAFPAAIADSRQIGDTLKPCSCSSDIKTKTFVIVE